MAKGGKADKWAARGARLSAALRENLKRRKAQARKREFERGPGQAASAGAGKEIAHQAGGDSPQPGAESGGSPEFRRNPVHE
jgi:hypothetical protein